MYRITPYVALDDTMHFIVANLVHRGGWVLVDAFIAGVTETSWPAPTAATPALVNGDYAILQPPDSGLSACGDAIRVLFNAGASIDIDFHRLLGGAGDAWVLSTHTVDVAATSSTVMSYVPVNEVLVFSSTRSLVVADIDTATNNIVSGFAVGYMETAALRDPTDLPALGAGTDPYPICWFSLNNTVAGAPVVGTTFGIGQTLKEDDTATACSVISQLLATADDALFYPVAYGGGIPVHVLEKAIVLHDVTGGTPYVRGTFSAVYLTTKTIAKSVLRTNADESEYIVIGHNVAVGPA